MINLWRLLLKQISFGQFLGFFAANLVGMVILLLGVQFYSDSEPIFSGGESFLRADYMVISKPVEDLGAFDAQRDGFSDEQIDDIENQPFVRGVGKFTPALFRVTAGIAMPNMGGLYTDFFFESVPDKYVDVDLKDWKYEEGDEIIPIVIPRNYLNLYNFGFAQSRNMPKLTEDVISMLMLDITASGNGEKDKFSGQVVGFSSRLNTILVPESFVEWANKKYSSKGEMPPSRLIVEVDNPANEQIPIWLKANNLQSEGGKEDAGEAAYFMRLIVTIVVAIGLVISLLALYILMLSIFLLLQKNTEKLENLLLMGYGIGKVALPYQFFAVVVSLFVAILSVVVVGLIRPNYLTIIEDLAGGATSGLWLCIVSSSVIFIITSLLNCLIIRRKITKLWKSHRVKK